MVMGSTDRRQQCFVCPMSAKGALDEEARTLNHVVAAFAVSSRSCIHAMANKAQVQGIAAENVMETVRIVRFSLAIEFIGDAAPVVEELQRVR